MPGKEEKVEQVSEVKAEELEAQTIAPTQEEIDAMKAQAKEEGKAEAQKEYQGIQRTVSAKDREIKELKRQVTQPSKRGDRTSEVLLEEMRAKQAEDGVTNPRIAQLEADLAQERHLDYMEKLTREWREKLDRKITEVGLDPSDEAFDDVWESFDIAYAVDGKFERVDKKLDRVLTKTKQEAKPPESEKKETKTYTEEDLEEEKRRWMEEHGLLATESGGPSGVASKWEEVRDKYIEDPTNPQVKAEYMRLRRERGL